MYSQKGFHFHEQGVPQKQKIYMFLMGPIQLNGKMLNLKFKYFSLGDRKHQNVNTW